MVAHVALNVAVRRFVGGQQIALPCVVAAGQEGVEGDAGGRAPDQDAAALLCGTLPSTNSRRAPTNWV
jgi:hypothetical protein